MNIRGSKLLHILYCLSSFVVISSAQAQLLQDTSTVHHIQKDHIISNVPNLEKHELLIKDEIKRYFKFSKTEQIEIRSDLLRVAPTQSGLSYPKFYRWVTVFKNKWPIISGAIKYDLIDKRKAEITDFVDSQYILNDSSMSLRVFPPVVYKVAKNKAQAMKLIQNKCSDSNKFERSSKFSIADGYFLGSDKGEWIGKLEFHSKDGNQYQIVNKNIKSIFSMNDRIFIVNGLGHLRTDIGEINELKLKNGKWIIFKTFQLPAEPIAFKNLNTSSIRISTRKGIVVFGLDQPLEYIDCNF